MNQWSNICSKTIIINWQLLVKLGTNYPNQPIDAEQGPLLLNHKKPMTFSFSLE